MEDIKSLTQGELEIIGDKVIEKIGGYAFHQGLVSFEEQKRGFTESQLIGFARKMPPETIGHLNMRLMKREEFARCFPKELYKILIKKINGVSCYSQKEEEFIIENIGRGTRYLSNVLRVGEDAIMEKLDTMGLGC